MTEGDDDKRQVSREEAHEIIDEAAAGTIVAIAAEPVPTLGDVPEDDREHDLEVWGYRFGDVDDYL